jgi:hypothetical protein
MDELQELNQNVADLVDTNKKLEKQIKKYES